VRNKPIAAKDLVIGKSYRFINTYSLIGGSDDSFVGTYLGFGKDSAMDIYHEVLIEDSEYYVIISQYKIWELTGLEAALL
jgi:hypothetical protein